MPSLMKFHPFVIACALAACSGVVIADETKGEPAAATKAQYEFGYRSSGEPGLIPLQVFDDGKNTYFKMRTTKVVPEIYLVTDVGKQPLRILRSSPYLVVNALGAKFEVRYGELVATVVSTAATAPKTVLGAEAALLVPTSSDRMPSDQPPKATPAPKSNYGPVNPIEGGGQDVSYLERTYTIPFLNGKFNLGPAALQTVDVVMAVPGRVDQVTITGREGVDSSDGIAQLRAYAIRDRLMSLGVSPEKIVTKTGISNETSQVLTHSMVSVVWSQAKAKAIEPTASGPATTPQNTNTGSTTSYKASVEDGSVAKTLGRWASQSGWTLVWDASQQPHLTANASYSGDFIKAAAQLLRDVGTAGYELEVEAYSNNVLRVADKFTEKRAKP